MTHADATGQINTIVTVRRLLTNGFNPPTDCADATGTCVLRASPSAFSADPAENAETPLAFDPAASPPPSPPVTVTPTTGLADGEAVTVTGA